MSDDEFAAVLISGIIAVAAWLRWYARVARVQPIGVRTRGRAILAGTPLLAAVVLFAVLKTAAAQDVRDDTTYVVFYLVLGAGWLGVASWLLPLLGVSARDDVLERGNRAASYAVGGALLAVALCFAGGNVGDGPGWWVVIFSAGLATGVLTLLWLALDAVAGVADRITVERDAAAGVRAAGLLIATGAILGRAVAGDWVSIGATVRDFVAFGWPALAVVVAAALLERGARATPVRPAPPVGMYGALPAVLYLAAAALYVYRLGLPA